MKNFEIKDSSIHGKGVFSSKHIRKGEKIGLAIHFMFRLFPVITDDLGVWINHCSSSNKKTNSILVWDDSSEAHNTNKVGWYLVASRNIRENEEIFMDYAETPFYIEGPQDYYTC